LSLDILADPLFRVPFLVGLTLAAVLPLLGVLLRFREEWLAALGLAHLAGASGLLGMAIHLPVVAGAALGAMAGAAVKNFWRMGGNTVYAMMILVGWAATLLVAANTGLGSVMGHALVEGQLYFAGLQHLAAALIVAAVAVIAVPWLAPRLAHARLFPGEEVANRKPSWRWHVSFDMLVALAIAAGTASLGLMAAFALAFIPPWVAFRLSRDWRSCFWISVGFAVPSYIISFACALLFDQPFGPVLVAVLILLGGASRLILKQRA
jgi:zinc/manganese transport system permease protein